MSDPVLEARSVDVVRRDQHLLESVSLSVGAGDRILVRGQSGAGKTTLFRVLGLLDRPNGGEVLVDSTATGGLPEDERARLRRESIGIVFQEFNLIPDLTAQENAAVPMTHAGDPDQDWLDDLFSRLELTAVADQYPATLSGGEKQRVAIARALTNGPAVVLADEPTGQLDPETATQVMDLLFDVQADLGTALVVVSHDPTIGAAFEQCYRLADGTIASDPEGLVDGRG